MKQSIASRPHVLRGAIFEIRQERWEPSLFVGDMRRG